VRPVFDSHRHFTGSLPVWFICAEACRRQSEPQVAQAIYNLVGSYELTPEGLRTACRRKLVRSTPAYLQFFELYELIQSITKPNEKSHDDFYFRAGRAIATQARREQASISLIMGANHDINFFVRRIRSTLRGAKAGRLKPLMQIRATFIRNVDGSYKNLNCSTIDALFDCLERDDEVDGYVCGVDFCGVEKPQEPQPVLDALEQIYARNQHRVSRGRKFLEISVHAGEDLVHSSLAAHLDFLETLCTRACSPQTIAHGTLLWIRAEDAGLDREQRRQREACLRAMATRGIALEVCPTANLRMTPLIRRSHIPFGDLSSAGVQVRVGSDNPVLLGTTIRREIRFLRRD
jgi:hypothetical protein